MAIPLYKLIDKYVGIPLCLALGVTRIFGKPKALGAPKRIIFIKLWAVGDSIVMMPLVKAVREKYQDAEIELICRKRNKEVFECFKEIDHIHLFEPGFRNLINSISLLRRYDLSIDGEPYLRLSAILSFWFSGKRIGWAGHVRSLVYNLPVPFERTRHMAQNYLAMGEPIGADYAEKTLVKPQVRKIDQEHAHFALESRGVKPRDVVIGACPCVAESSKSRQWMPERFAETLDILAKKHKAKIVFFGARGDVEAVNEVRSMMKGPSISIAGQMTLPQTFAALSRCNLMISVDTGPMHAAAAMGTPTIGLFGPNIPTLWAPYGPGNTAIYHPLDCSPCIINEKGIMPQCKRKDELHKCMKMITVEEVVKEAEKIL